MVCGKKVENENLILDTAADYDKKHNIQIQKQRRTVKKKIQTKKIKLKKNLMIYHEAKEGKTLKKKRKRKNQIPRTRLKERKL